jgi:hypothetical protein
MFDDFKDVPVNLLVIGIFLLCILGFGTGIMALNGHSGSMNTGYIDTTRLETQLNQTSENAQAWQTVFTSDNIFVSSGAIVLYSIWGIIKLLWTTTITFWIIYTDIITSVLGIPSIITGILTSILIIILIFLGWKAIKQG